MIEQPLTLPCGGVLSNRLCKAAMTEGLAGADGIPGAALNRLYGIWSDGGAGLLLSGNVQIDRDHLERPGNVVVDAEPDDSTRAASARKSSTPIPRPRRRLSWVCREVSLASRLR